MSRRSLRGPSPGLDVPHPRRTQQGLEAGPQVQPSQGGESAFGHSHAAQSPRGGRVSADPGPCCTPGPPAGWVCLPPFWAPLSWGGVRDAHLSTRLPHPSSGSSIRAGPTGRSWGRALQIHRWAPRCFRLLCYHPEFFRVSMCSQVKVRGQRSIVGAEEMPPGPGLPLPHGVFMDPQRGRPAGPKQGRVTVPIFHPARGCDDAQGPHPLRPGRPATQRECAGDPPAFFFA